LRPITTISSFTEIEAVLQDERTSYVRVAEALECLQEKGFYRTWGYDNLDQYLQDRWGYSKQYFKTISIAARVARDISGVTRSVPTVAQAAFMASLTKPQLLSLAKKIDFTKVTVLEIRQKVAGIRGVVAFKPRKQDDWLPGQRIALSLQQTIVCLRDAKHEQDIPSDTRQEIRLKMTELFELLKEELSCV